MKTSALRMWLRRERARVFGAQMLMAGAAVALNSGPNDGRVFAPSPNHPIERQYQWLAKMPPHFFQKPN